MKKAEDILQSFIKGDIKRDYSEQDKQYYTVYLQSAIDSDRMFLIRVVLCKLSFSLFS